MLPRMTPQQRKRANALIRKTCCNYDNGNCIALDDGEECVCPQTISYSVLCKWFRSAVLPADKALYTEVMQPHDIRRCAVCSKAFSSTSNNAKYCEGCAKTVQRRQKAVYARKRRSGVARRLPSSDPPQRV